MMILTERNGYCCLEPFWRLFRRLCVTRTSAHASMGSDGGHALGHDGGDAVNALNAGGLNGRRIIIGGRAMELDEVRRLIPELEERVAARESEMKEKDKALRQQESVIAEQLNKIDSLEKDIQELKAECDKLRSVLGQRSPRDESKTSQSSAEVMAQLQQEANMNGQASNRVKKQGVSAESDVYSKTDKAELVRHEKSANAKKLILDAILKNDFLRHLDKDQVVEMVECMYEKNVPANCWVIREGEAGAHLYVGAEGDMEVSKDGKVLGALGPGRVFGELAILYNCTRTASVRALTPVNMWVLDRGVFQMITMRMGLQRHEQVMQFLHQVPLLKPLPEERMSKVADCLDQDFYSDGTYIIREGDRGDSFFIILSGQVNITQMLEGYDEPQEIRTLNKGDYFGEKALLGEDLRTASVVALSPGVEVLTLDRDSFKKMIGDLKEIQTKDYGDEERKAKLLAGKRARTKDSGYESSDKGIGGITGHGADGVSPRKKEEAQLTGEIDPEFRDLEIRQLKSIATLGVGGFGRVEMVHISGDKSRAFALKAMKKRHIVDTRQQEHIFSERTIMLELRHQFIVRLFRTFRDRKYVYMLLEVCLGGELWTILRDKGHFDDNYARFYTSCVLEALEFLHNRGIIYRDLKPENCLLDSTGYLKVVDFGFAKKIGTSGRKTWTFCGTPEYVAPEIILNKGHDRSADFWALGIYICELLLGRPPFQASDPMKTYTLILKGIDALDIPNKRIGKTVAHLVKKLCRDNSGERLGCQSGGIDDIRKHKWFVGTDWEALRARSQKPPYVPKVHGPLDASNFDQYPPDGDVPPDELSGWDDGF